MPNALQGLIFPLKYESGVIIDGSGKEVIKANRDANSSPLAPYGRDALLKLTVKLLNTAFYYDQTDQILKELGY